LGKKTSKTTSSTTLPSWATGLAKQGGNLIYDTVSGNQPNLQGIAGDIQSQLSGLASAAFGPNPGLSAANGYAQDVLGGKYLNSNPMTDAMVRQGEQDAGNAVNSTFSQYGRTGGGNHAMDLARGVAQAGNAIRFGQYNQERQNQQQAAGMLPGLTAAQFAGVPAYLSAAQTAGQLPYAGLGPLASMGGLWAGQGTTTSTQPGGWGTALLGGLSNMFSFAPISLSDRRLKADIKELGDWDGRGDGLKRYAFRYKWEKPGTRHEGVMADEVKRLRPAAYVKGFLHNEYDGVNYAALGVA
jgi:hypothetical protein